MIERKDTVTGRGNHEKVAGHLQTGSVRSQGENSLTLFLLTVHHFVGKIAVLEFGFTPSQTLYSYGYPFSNLIYMILITYAHAIV